MNPVTIVGIVGGIVLVVFSIWVTSYEPTLFLNIPGLLFVLGGTLSATIVSFPPSYIWHVLKSFIKAIKNERLYDNHDVEEIVEVARLWERGEIHKTDDYLSRIKSPFLQTGLRLVIDGNNLSDIQDLLEWRIERLRIKENSEASVFHVMASYSPAFGMLGTLLGLVNMLYQIRDGSTDSLGSNMAVALITTFYGLLLANIIFKPIATKLEDRTIHRLRTLSFAMEAVALVSEKRSPVYIRETLNSFLAEYEDEINATDRDLAALEDFKHG